MDLSKIGKTIKDKRQEMNLSLRELSALSQVAGSTISQIETGKTSPNLLTLKAICDTLDIPVFSLFLEEDSQVQLVRFGDQKSFVRNTSNGFKTCCTLRRTINSIYTGIRHFLP